MALSNFTLAVQGTGTSEGDSIDVGGTTNALDGNYNRFLIEGDGSSAITLDMASPPIPMGTAILGVYIEVHSGSVDVTFDAAGTVAITLSASNGPCVFALAPVELSYLKVAPTQYSTAEISILSRP